MKCAFAPFVYLLPVIIFCGLFLIACTCKKKKKKMFLYSLVGRAVLIYSFQSTFNFLLDYKNLIYKEETYNETKLSFYYLVNNMQFLFHEDETNFSYLSTIN